MTTNAEAEPKTPAPRRPLAIVECSQIFREPDPSALTFISHLAAFVGVHIDSEESYSIFGRLQLFGGANAIIYILDINEEAPQFTYWPHMEQYQETAAYWHIPFVLVVERGAPIPPWYCDAIVLDVRIDPAACANAVVALAYGNLREQPQLAMEFLKEVRLKAVLARCSPGAASIDWHVLKYYRDFPDELPNIRPDVFEQFVAEIMRGIGYEVTITSRTHDGGRDIIASRTDSLSRERLLVECKQSAAGRTISVNTVRALLGVLSDEKASRGILVTTSRLSSEANKLVERNRYRLESIERPALLTWIDDYFLRARRKGDEERRMRIGSGSRWPYF